MHKIPSILQLNFQKNKTKFFHGLFGGLSSSGRMILLQLPMDKVKLITNLFFNNLLFFALKKK